MAQPRKLHDKFFKQAKAEGFAARSAYKLDEIIRKRRVVRRGDWVLDLGCAPGSWVQVASKVVGETGFVLGLDLKPVSIPGISNAHTLVGDVFQTDAESLLREAGLLEQAVTEPARAGDGQHGAGDAGGIGGAGGRGGRVRDRFDVILSDMAPSTEGGGGGITDHFRSVELCRRVLEILPKVLRPGGHVVMKVFEGEAYPDLVRDAGRLFKEAKGFKPQASRDVSREMFVIAIGYEPAMKAMPRRANPAIAKAPPAPIAGWGSRGGGGEGGGSGRGAEGRKGGRR